MAGKRSGKCKDILVAKLVCEEKLPCVFCKREIDDEVVYGKLYAIGDIQCHYFCVLLSSCLVQKGKDEQGLFGFLYTDILAEVERSKKHKCSYCHRGGATLGCSISQCRKQFHLPCGRERDAVSLFYGNYKSFCSIHAPKQNISENIMAKARLRMQPDKKKHKKARVNHNKYKNMSKLEVNIENEAVAEDENKIESDYVCVICYEKVDGYPTLQTFWPPCCAKDAWFHRHCLQRMALSAGIHYLKCPLCNDKENFYQAVIGQGYYVPDRDAAWELEQNAFAEIYERPSICSAVDCVCPMGRKHDADNGLWDIKLCILCGSTGAHAQCLTAAGIDIRHVCVTCQPVAPADLDQLALLDIPPVVQPPSRRSNRHGPVMPSRMSLRRTKQRVLANNSESSSSLQMRAANKTDSGEQPFKPSDLATSRRELNLKSPKKPSILEPNVLKDLEGKLLSPIKLLEMGLSEKISCLGVRNVQLDTTIVEEMRERFKKPRPLSEKKKIVNDLLDGLFNNLLKESPKSKEPIKEWSSPKKFCENSPIVEVQKNVDTVVEKVKEPVSEDENSVQIIEDDITEVIEILEDQEIVEVKEESHENKTSQVTPQKKIQDLIILDSTPIVLEEKSQDSVIIVEDNMAVTQPTSKLANEVFGNIDSLPIFDTPKKLKTVDIQKDSSMEISENDHMVNVDVVKIEDNCQNNDFMKNVILKVPIRNKKCAFKFSPVDKETLQRSNVDIDLESFKSHYLNEVDRDFKNFNNKNDLGAMKDKLNEGTTQKSESKRLKRKLSNENVARKKRKLSKKKPVNSNNENINNLNVKIKNKRVKKSKKKLKTKISIPNRDIKLKIHWKKEQLRLKISHSTEKRRKKQTDRTGFANKKSLKQLVLQYSPEVTSLKDTIVKPEHEVTPLKRKYIKQEKSPDNLYQTTLQNFFMKLPNKN